MGGFHPDLYPGTPPFLSAWERRSGAGIVGRKRLGGQHLNLFAQATAGRQPRSRHWSALSAATHVSYNNDDMKFAVIADYDAADPQLPVVRPVHREYLTKLRDAGKLAFSGPFTDHGGALIMLEAESKEEAAAIVYADPFVKAGVFKSWGLRPWNPVFANKALLPD
jgi:uncharacterized protein YciI